MKFAMAVPLVVVKARIGAIDPSFDGIANSKREGAKAVIRFSVDVFITSAAELRNRHDQHATAMAVGNDVGVECCDRFA